MSVEQAQAERLGLSSLTTGARRIGLADRRALTRDEDEPR